MATRETGPMPGTARKLLSPAELSPPRTPRNQAMGCGWMRQQELENGVFLGVTMECIYKAPRCFGVFQISWLENRPWRCICWENAGRECLVGLVSRPPQYGNQARTHTHTHTQTQVDTAQVNQINIHIHNWFVNKWRERTKQRNDNYHNDKILFKLHEAFNTYTSRYS